MIIPIYWLHGSYIIQSSHLYHLSGSIPPIPLGDVDNTSPGESLQILPGAVFYGGEPPGHSHLHGATAPDSSAPGACGTPGVDRWSLWTKISSLRRESAKGLGIERETCVSNMFKSLEHRVYHTLRIFRPFWSISEHLMSYVSIFHGFPWKN